jgi:hypothetical protein
MAGRAVAADLAGVLSGALTIRRLELSLASPPLSYVSPARRHSRPLVARLGFLLE